MGLQVGDVGVLRDEDLGGGLDRRHDVDRGLGHLRLPATYISGGNGDGLTWLQSIPMAKRLQELGVDVTPVFWPAPHEPALPHEYQFHLDLPEARKALADTIAFLDAHTR